jgi:hypothetical protein
MSIHPGVSSLDVALVVLDEVLAVAAVDPDLAQAGVVGGRLLVTPGLDRKAPVSGGASFGIP